MLLPLLCEQAPRVLYLAFSGYALVLLLTRWIATRVLSVDKRFLLLFFLLEVTTTVTAGALKIAAGVPVDAASWLTVLSQSFLCAYLYYAVPPHRQAPAAGR